MDEIDLDDITVSFKKNINKIYTEFISSINNIIEGKEKNILDLREDIVKYSQQANKLSKQCKTLTEECENFQKVSIMKNLNKQLFEKNNTIKILEKKIVNLEKKNIKMDIKVDSVVDKNGNNESTIVDETDNTESSSVVDETDNTESSSVVDETDNTESNSVVDETESTESSSVVDETDNTESNSVVDETDNTESSSVVDDSSEGNEEEVEIYEKKLKSPITKKMTSYYISDDANKDIYEKLVNDEIGECVGRLVGKNNRPFFFK
jgi:hypothetical protein